MPLLLSRRLAAGRRGHARSARRRLRQAVDQERGQARRDRPRDPLHRPDDARRARLARPRPLALREGGLSRRPARRASRRSASTRTWSRSRRKRCAGRASRSPRSRPRSPAVSPRSTSSCATPKRRWRSGADEIDMVIDRGAFLAGDEQLVFDEIVAVKKLCGPVHLKAILETGELGSYDATRRASDLALEAGADVIKTSTGKIGTSATLATALVMSEAIRDFAQPHRRAARPQGRRRRAQHEVRDRVPRADRRNARRGLALARAVPHRRVARCSTTCCCSARSSRPAATARWTTSRKTEPGAVFAAV